MDNNKCPKCGNTMQFDIEFEYDHSPYHCNHCGYAEGCSNWFTEGYCNRCTEYIYCKKWFDIQNGDSDINIPRCLHCGKKCTEIQEYIDVAKEENTTPEIYVRQDGTFSRSNNTFICTTCYVKNELL